MRLGLAVLCGAFVGCGGSNVNQPTEGPASSGAAAETRAAELSTCSAPKASAAGVTSGEQLGFRPLEPAELGSWTGKTVYAGKTMHLLTKFGREDGPELAAGEPLTLCGVEAKKERPSSEPAPGRRARTRSFGKSDGPKNDGSGDPVFVVVKSAAGSTGRIQARRLSSRPLAFDLRGPAEAHDLMLAVAKEAELVGRALQDERPSDTDWAGRARARAMKESLDADIAFLHAMTYGYLSRDSLIRKKSWALGAKDPKVMDYLSHGIKEPETKKRFAAVEHCARRWSRIATLTETIAVLEREKASKPWRRGVQNGPAAQLEALDAEKIEAIDRRIEQNRQAIEQAQTDSACEASPE